VTIIPTIENNKSIYSSEVLSFIFIKYIAFNNKNGMAKKLVPLFNNTLIFNYNLI